MLILWWFKFEILNNKGRFFLGYKSITKKQAETIITEMDFTPSVGNMQMETVPPIPRINVQFELC